ncbi:MAG: hydroxymethylbilane synthase [Candidatus Competibacterales bacterium]|nr:hydroxymethylbilane synthase [Candidatus Competibacterales bacterium]
MNRTIRIATRKSPLALWQAEHVAGELRRHHAGVEVELVAMSTRGDQLLDAPLAKVGGKGLFIKELEVGLLDGRADLAVHSMKDVPVEFPDGLELTTILARENPCDAFVSNHYRHPDELLPGARVGTCSLRRQCQLAARYPLIELHNLRGNVNTRLAKLDAGEFDAIILAAAGLQRLEMDERIACVLEPEISLPAIGQGVIGIECRSEDHALHALLAPLDDAPTRTRIGAERALNARLQGSCQVPIAGYAELQAEQLRLRGRVGKPDGSQVLSAERTGPAEQPEALGYQLAEDLRAQGADRLLAELLEAL